MNNKIRNLKAILFPSWVYLVINRSNGMLCQIFHLRCNILIEIDILPAEGGVKVSLKLKKRNFISIFMLPVILAMLLYSIIGQMNVLVLKIL